MTVPFQISPEAEAAQPAPAPVTIIHHAEVLGKQFQIYGTKESPLFLAKDVAEWIEHSDVSTMLRNLDADEKGTNIICTPGGKQAAMFITEDGLYEVLMLSRKPIAKSFKRQVKQILREIRTNGGYMAARMDETPEELYERAMSMLRATIARQKAQLREMHTQLETQAPTVEYCSTVLAATNLHTVNSIATHLGISAVRLNKFLMDQGFIYRSGGLYYPSAKIRGKGYCDFEIVPYINSQGEKMTREHLKWTEEGRRFVIDAYRKTAEARKAE